MISGAPIQGEDDLVRELAARVPVAHPDVLCGIGDDCAVVAGEKVDLLLKIDSVVAGVHFRDEEDFRRVGRKALSRALSDIAAMGGRPSWAMIALIVPEGLPLERLDSLYRGIGECAIEFGVTIVGGEVSVSPGPLAVTVTLTGSVPHGGAVLRSGGTAGDSLWVTGVLGGSIAGHHLDFRPRVIEGEWLAGFLPPSCMMDLSDGLAADAPRLARASGCGFEIEPSLLPVRTGCTIQDALCAGEDYELLFAAKPDRDSDLQESWLLKFPEVPLTRIGRLTGSGTPDLGAGYDHLLRRRK